VFYGVESAVQNLPANVLLRAGDAVHLVTAKLAGFSEIWTNDRRLLQAAPHFGLTGKSVENGARRNSRTSSSRRPDHAGGTFFFF
jgi:hypothetical protein